MIAVEVLSETNTQAEIRLKLLEYFESDSRLAWVIDPATRTVAVYIALTAGPARVLTDRDTLDGGDVLPGFSFSVAELFRAGAS